MKKVLDFRWSKNAKITLKTISFWRNISISVFRFSPVLHIIKTWWWNLINFSDFTNAFIRKEKNTHTSKRKEKNTHTAANENRKTGESWTLFYKSLFYKVIQNDNSSQDIYLFRCRSQRNYCSLISGNARNIKEGNWERQSSRNGKLQYLFQN